MSEWDIRIVIFCLGFTISGIGFMLGYLDRIKGAMGRIEKLLTDIRDSHDHAEGFRRFDR